MTKAEDAAKHTSHVTLQLSRLGLASVNGTGCPCILGPWRGWTGRVLYPTTQQHHPPVPKYLRTSRSSCLARNAYVIPLVLVVLGTR